MFHTEKFEKLTTFIQLNLIHCPILRDLHSKQHEYEQRIAKSRPFLIFYNEWIHRPTTPKNAILFKVNEASTRRFLIHIFLSGECVKNQAKKTIFFFKKDWRNKGTFPFKTVELTICNDVANGVLWKILFKWTF